MKKILTQDKEKDITVSKQIIPDLSKTVSSIGLNWVDWGFPKGEHCLVSICHCDIAILLRCIKEEYIEQKKFVVVSLVKANAKK